MAILYWVPYPGPYPTPSFGTINTPSVETQGCPNVTSQHHTHTQSAPNVNIRSHKYAQHRSYGPFPLCILTRCCKVSNYPPSLSLTPPSLSYCVLYLCYCCATQTRVSGATFRSLRFLHSNQGGIVAVPVGWQGLPLPTNHAFSRASASPISIFL